MADLTQGGEITADGDYDIPTKPGRLYTFGTTMSGTGTCTVKSELGNSGNFMTYRLPDDDTADFVIQASGTIRGGTIRAQGDSIRFTVASASGLSLRIYTTELGKTQS